MLLKHKVTIKVTSKDGDSQTVMTGAQMSLPSRIIKFLFGDFQQVYLLNPGQTVEAVDVEEVKTKGGYAPWSNSNN